MSVKELLNPPDSLDHISKEEISSLLRQVLIVIPIVSIIISFTFLINDQLVVGRIILFIPIISILCQAMLMRGHLHSAMITILFTLITLTTYVAIQTRGIHSVAIVVLPIILLFSSLIMNYKGVIAVASLIISCLAMISFIGPSTIDIDSKPLYQSMGDFIIVTILLLTNVFVNISFTNLIKRSLQRANDELENRERIKERIKENLEQKKILVREVHHRVKNSLAMVNSFIELEAMTLEDGKTEFQSLREVVQTIGRAHDPLYQDHNYKDISIKPYIEKIISVFSQTNHLEQVKMEISDGTISHENALSLGILLQELFSLLAEISIMNGLFKIWVSSPSSEIRMHINLNSSGSTSTSSTFSDEDLAKIERIKTFMYTQGGQINYSDNIIDISIPLNQSSLLEKETNV